MAATYTVVNVKDYGATGNGTTDDYTSINTAIAACSGGAVLYVPAGTYAVTHGLCIPYDNVQIRGDGAGISIIKAKSGIGSTAGLVSLGYNSSYVNVGGTDNLYMADVSVDANGLSWGVVAADLTNTILERVTAKNSLRAAFAAFECVDMTVQFCQALTSLATDQYGDGIYFQGCTRPRALYNHVEDFTRVGICVEAGEGIISSDAHIVGNFITYGHDNTNPEANSGIWCEGTNSNMILNNRITNMYNNPDTQMPRGITIGPYSEQADAFFHIQGNHIEDVFIGVSTNAQNSSATTLIEGNVIRAGLVYTSYQYGVHIGSGHVVKVLNNTFGATTFSTSQGTVFVDTYSNIDTILVAGNNVAGITHAANSGDVFVYNLHGYIIENLHIANQQCHLAVNAGVSNLYITNCVLTGDSSGSLKPIRANTRLIVTNSTYTTVAGTAMINAISGSIAQFTNCQFPYVAFATSTSTASSPLTIKFTDCYFGSGSYFELNGATNLSFDACRMEDYRAYASGGFLKTNNANQPTHIRIRNCDFVSANSEIPLKLWTYQPTSLVITGCTSPAGLGALTRGYGALIAEGCAGIDVVARASLPAAGASQDGRILIDDNGTGDRNLMIYAGTQRFRIDGGAAV